MFKQLLAPHNPIQIPLIKQGGNQLTPTISFYRCKKIVIIPNTKVSNKSFSEKTVGVQEIRHIPKSGISDPLRST